MTHMITWCHNLQHFFSELSLAHDSALLARSDSAALRTSSQPDRNFLKHQIEWKFAGGSRAEETF